ncbi:MAG: hypothetical protein KKE23_00215 [Nanoarchaeota archaeon]|nr:hypothetical protein [Nanoarchaeota archaeon]
MSGSRTLKSFIVLEKRFFHLSFENARELKTIPGRRKFLKFSCARNQRFLSVENNNYGIGYLEKRVNAIK